MRLIRVLIAAGVVAAIVGVALWLLVPPPATDDVNAPGAHAVGGRAAAPRADGGSSTDGGSDPGWLAIPVPEEAAFRTLGGTPAGLEEYRGQVVLLNFWGTWCPPCLFEIPHLVELQPVLQGLGATIVAPAVDSGSPEEIRAFIEEHGIEYPVWTADMDVAVREFGAPGFPFTLLIDRRGVIRKRFLGPQTRETLLTAVRALRRDAAEGGLPEPVTRSG